MEHLDNLPDLVEFLLRNVEPLVEGQCQLASYLLSGDLGDVMVWLQEYLKIDHKKHSLLLKLPATLETIHIFFCIPTLQKSKTMDNWDAIFRSNGFQLDKRIKLQKYPSIPHKEDCLKGLKSN